VKAASKKSTKTTNTLTKDLKRIRGKVHPIRENQPRGSQLLKRFHRNNQNRSHLPEKLVQKQAPNPRKRNPPLQKRSKKS